MARTLKILFFLLFLLLIVGGIYQLRNRPPEVLVVQPRSLELSETLAVSGRVQGRQESRLAPAVNGVVRKVLVEEGQRVEAGQVLAEIETSTLRAQVQQAQRAVQVAQAQLAVAKRGPRASELEEARAETSRAVETATANLASARQRLLEASRGPRIEDVRRAESELQRVEADLAQKQREAERQDELFQKGAVSQQASEQAKTAYLQAQAAKGVARQQLLELQNGTRPEQLEQARLAVQAAEAELAGAQRGGSARIETVQNRSRQEDVDLAQAQVGEAQAALELAEQQLALASVEAPYDGMVGRQLLKLGDMAGPNAAIFTFASQPALEILIEIDESERSRVTEDMLGLVRASGYEGTFEARVKEFSAEIDSQKGTLEVRLWPTDSPHWLLPGQTVDVNLIISPQAERLSIPLTCVKLDGRGSSVMVIKDGRVEAREVVVSTPTTEGYLVLSGVQESDWLVQFPQSLEEGQRVRPKRVVRP